MNEIMPQRLNIKPIPKVSICVVTYNQKNYLRECLDSLVSQETDFEFEIIVGDDASTDGTSDIVKEYAKKYPELIVSVLHDRNIGAVANMIYVYRLAKGKYIAHMDGDDFAFPQKLKIQVHRLEENPDCNICSHDAILVNAQSEKIANRLSKHKNGVSTLADLYKKLPFFTHSTKMFRNDAFSAYYDNFTNETIDMELHVEQAKKGNIYHIDMSLGGYRRLVGISSVGSRVNKLIPQATRRIFDDALATNNCGLTKGELRKAYANAIFNFAYQSAFFGDQIECRKYITESISIKITSALQVCFFIASFFPNVAVSIARTRTRIKHALSLLGTGGGNA
jgi:glycosyltransferase involved in cell wall biosynthesis